MSVALAADPGVRSAIDLLSAWIESQVAHGDVPSVSIGIVHEQALLWARGFGLASRERKEPATPDTLYRIASITKLFTSTAILQLRDAGRLRLDDPLVQHLPWFSMDGAHPDAPVVTIRHLLTHTAGLPREAGSPYWSDGDFPTADQIRERLPRQRTALPPEKEWKYSNLGLVLAGEVVTAASGQPYEDYVRARILAPLGMSATWVSTPPADQPGLATGYTRRLPAAAREPAPFTEGRGITAAANMTSCVTDLARFAMLQFRDGPAGGAQVLRGSTLREMQRVHWLEPDWSAGWGLGFRITREGGKTYVGHSGSLRGHRTLVHLCPADRLGVIALINADDGIPLLFAQRAFQWVAPVVLKAAASAAPPGLPEGWQRYAGKYRNPWADTQVLAIDGGLAMIDPSQPDPTLTLGRLVPVADHTFRLETRNGFGSTGELVIFELGPDGSVQRVRVGDNYTYPIVDW